MFFNYECEILFLCNCLQIYFGMRPRHFKANNLNEDTRRFYKSIIAQKRILTLNKITIFNAKALSNICTKRKLRVKCIPVCV